MAINADFRRQACVHAAALDWQPSPMPGVARRMLDRVGEEVARATSIVRYDPGSCFSAHRHELGEEFLVLEGVFQDEDGAYPAGSYVRNPPGSSHTPRSDEGCVLFVKLRQFSADDTVTVRHSAEDIAARTEAMGAGAHAATLHADHREQVRIEQWDAGATVQRHGEGGIEVLVLSGDCIAAGETLRRHSWLRLPPGEALHATAGADGCRIWIKIGALADVA